MGEFIALLDDEDVWEVDCLCGGFVLLLILEGEDIVLGDDAPSAEIVMLVPSPGLEDARLLLQKALVQDAAHLLLELLLADRHLLLIP